MPGQGFCDLHVFGPFAILADAGSCWQPVHLAICRAGHLTCVFTGAPTEIVCSLSIQLCTEAMRRSVNAPHKPRTGGTGQLTAAGEAWPRESAAGRGVLRPPACYRPARLP